MSVQNDRPSSQDEPRDPELGPSMSSKDDGKGDRGMYIALAAAVGLIVLLVVVQLMRAH